MPLSDTAIRQAKPREKQYKLSDEKGLYLLSRPNGGKWWRSDYRFEGKRKTLSMGIYLEVSLKEARARRDEAREKIANKIDPGLVRKVAKIEEENTFRAVALEWHEKMKAKWVESHAPQIAQCQRTRSTQHFEEWATPRIR